MQKEKNVSLGDFKHVKFWWKSLVVDRDPTYWAGKIKGASACTMYCQGGVVLIHECTWWLSAIGKSLVSIRSTVWFDCMASHTFLRSLRLIVCKRLLLWFPCRQWWRTQVARMSHVQSLSLAGHRLFLFPVHSYNSIELEGCSDNLAKVPLRQKIPKSYLPQHLVGHCLPCSLCSELGVHL